VTDHPVIVTFIDADFWTTEHFEVRSRHYGASVLTHQSWWHRKRPIEQRIAEAAASLKRREERRTEFEYLVTEVVPPSLGGAQ
jgi:hypothetical protein